MYNPIESYGVIGDMHTVALVGMDGSIDFCCLPNFDSPGIFAKILDDKKGGYFRIYSLLESQHKQMYLPDTNVLVTRFLSEEGVGEVVDFMPIQGEKDSKRHEIIRVVKAIRGQVTFKLECYPAFDWAQREHKVHMVGPGAVFDAGDMKVSLLSRFPLAQVGNGVEAEFTLSAGESITFILRQVEDEPEGSLTSARLAGEEALHHTVNFWRNWLKKCNYRGRWREMVYRSALVLKLLTYHPTGAIVAAPTTSLPEEIGGVRNWDYRYTWIRDASFTVYSFLRLGFTEEAAAFMGWLQERAKEGGNDGPLLIMYGIDGRHDLPEYELSHFEGYRQSGPVRIGNAAAEQLQLDIYGELIDSIYIYNKNAEPISYDVWDQIRMMAYWVCDNWDRPDDGIWEVRGGRQQFTYSKLQCWVALDRTLSMAAERSFPLEYDRIRKVRNEIYETVMAKGYNKKRNTFVQYFGTDAVDASNLIMPLVHFVSPTDPRMLGTIDHTMEELVSDSLVHRYEIGKGAGDGLTGGEGTFNMCTFWLVEALTRARRLEEARFIFEKMMTYANHLGLYAEEMGPNGEQLGNFPQAFTHMGLISAAVKLDNKLDRAHM